MNPWMFYGSDQTAQSVCNDSPLPSAKSADESTDNCGAKCDPTAVAVVVVSVMMMVMMRVTRRRGRRSLVVTLRRLVMSGGRGPSMSASAARSGKACSRKGEASKKRCENFECLVHITPSLSVLLLCASRAYNMIGDGAAKT
jgi:hypothetical protein